MDKLSDIMGGMFNRHREIEVFLTTHDSAQHLRLHGWLKRNDVLIQLPDKSYILNNKSKIHNKGFYNNGYYGNLILPSSILTSPADKIFAILNNEIRGVSYINDVFDNHFLEKRFSQRNNAARLPHSVNPTV